MLSAVHGFIVRLAQIKIDDLPGHLLRSPNFVSRTVGLAARFSAELGTLCTGNSKSARAMVAHV